MAISLTDAQRSAHLWRVNVQRLARRPTPITPTDAAQMIVGVLVNIAQTPFRFEWIDRPDPGITTIVFHPHQGPQVPPLPPDGLRYTEPEMMSRHQVALSTPNGSIALFVEQYDHKHGFLPPTSPAAMASDARLQRYRSRFRILSPNVHPGMWLVYWGIDESVTELAPSGWEREPIRSYPLQQLSEAPHSIAPLVRPSMPPSAQQQAPSQPAMSPPLSAAQRPNPPPQSQLSMQNQLHQSPQSTIPPGTVGATPPSAHVGQTPQQIMQLYQAAQASGQPLDPRLQAAAQYVRQQYAVVAAAQQASQNQSPQNQSMTNGTQGSNIFAQGANGMGNNVMSQSSQHHSPIPGQGNHQNALQSAMMSAATSGVPPGSLQPLHLTGQGQGQMGHSSNLPMQGQSVGNGGMGFAGNQSMTGTPPLQQTHVKTSVSPPRQIMYPPQQPRRSGQGGVISTPGQGSIGTPGGMMTTAGSNGPIRLSNLTSQTQPINPMTPAVPPTSNPQTRSGSTSSHFSQLPNHQTSNIDQVMLPIQHGLTHPPPPPVNPPAPPQLAPTSSNPSLPPPQQHPSSSPHLPQTTSGTSLQNQHYVSLTSLISDSNQTSDVIDRISSHRQLAFHRFRQNQQFIDLMFSPWTTTELLQDCDNKQVGQEEEEEEVKRRIEKCQSECDQLEIQFKRQNQQQQESSQWIGVPKVQIQSPSSILS